MVEEGVGGREIIRGSAVDLMSERCCCCCCCCCGDLGIDWTLGWSGDAVDDEEEEGAGGEVVVVEAVRRLVDDDDDDDVAVELLVEMMNLGRDGLAVVGRYGEEARGRVERAERS